VQAAIADPNKPGMEDDTIGITEPEKDEIETTAVSVLDETAPLASADCSPAEPAVSAYDAIAADKAAENKQLAEYNSGEYFLQ
jgi:hypothetical protein